MSVIKQLRKHLHELKHLGIIKDIKEYDIKDLEELEQEIYNDICDLHREHLDNPKTFDALTQAIQHLKEDMNKILQNQDNELEEDVDSANVIITFLEEQLEQLEEGARIKKHPPKIKISFRTETEYYWHAGLTGKKGEIIDSIKKKGLLPQSAIANKGNENTQHKDSSYVANDGKGALSYLKNSNGYRWETGGLPFVVCIEITELDKSYNIDSDIDASFLTQGTEIKGYALNNLAWFSFILTYNKIQDFIDADLGNDNATTKIKEDLAQISKRNPKKNQRKVWEIIMEEKRLFPSEWGFQDKVADDRWKLFLHIFNNAKDAKGIKIAGVSWQRNLSKKGGWDRSYIKRLYVLSPNKDKHWRKWAANMPADQEHICNWTQWKGMRGTDGNEFPGEGKLYRII